MIGFQHVSPLFCFFLPPVLFKTDFYLEQELPDSVFSALGTDLRWKVIKSLYGFITVR